MPDPTETLEIQGQELGPLATNSYAFRAPGGWVLVDAPEGAKTWLEASGIEPELLLLTHQHFDHVLGAGEVVERYGCPIWAFSERTPALTLEEMFKGLEGTAFEIAPYPVAELIEESAEGAPLDVLGAAIETLHVPGHSPDSLCFFSRTAGVVFGGDVLFAGGIGRTDFPGGDSDLLLESVREKLFPLGDHVRVLPGHGPETTVGIEKGSNPYFR